MCLLFCFLLIFAPLSPSVCARGVRIQKKHGFLRWFDENSGQIMDGAASGFGTSNVPPRLDEAAFGVREPAASRVRASGARPVLRPESCELQVVSVEYRKAKRKPCGHASVSFFGVCAGHFRTSGSSACIGSRCRRLPSSSLCARKNVISPHSPLQKLVPPQKLPLAPSPPPPHACFFRGLPRLAFGFTMVATLPPPPLPPPKPPPRNLPPPHPSHRSAPPPRRLRPTRRAATPRP